MEITESMIRDLAGEAGIGSGRDLTDREIRKVQQIAETYKDSDDAEILAEISKIKESLKKNRKLYDQQIAAVKSLRPMMTAKQKARLDRIIGLLEK